MLGEVYRYIYIQFLNMKMKQCFSLLKKKKKLIYVLLRLFSNFENLQNDLEVLPQCLPDIVKMWFYRVEDENKDLPHFIQLLLCVVYCFENHGINDNSLFSILQYYFSNRYI